MNFSILASTCKNACIGSDGGVQHCHIFTASLSIIWRSVCVRDYNIIRVFKVEHIVFQLENKIPRPVASHSGTG